MDKSENIAVSYRKPQWLRRQRKKWRVIAALACAVVVLLFLSNVLFGRLSEDNRLLFGSVTQEDSGERQSYINIERSLRVVSYNLWCNYLKVLPNWNLRERIEGLAEGIKDFDIALIQEAYILKTGITTASRCASILTKSMKKHGFHYRTSIADFIPPYVGQSGGIVIFSRIPLAKTACRQFQSYSIQLLPDYRGFVIGEYFLNSRHLYVVNTHLDHSQIKTRTLQAKELTVAIKSFAKLSHVIVSGDFNIDNDYPTLSNSSKEYIELLQTMNQAGLRPVFPFRMETNIDGGNYDAMFTSSNIAVEKKEIIKLVTNSKALVSDHFGLAVELKLL